MVDAGAPPPPPPPPPAPEAFPTAHVSTPPRPTANIVAPGAPQRPRAALPRYHSLGVSVIPSMMPLEDEESKADEEGDAATLTVEEELAQERAFNAMVAAHTEAEKEREECYKQARRTWVELRKRDG